MSHFSPIRFYHELRRRRMIKVTLIYLAGAWAVIGACDLLLPQLVVDVDSAMRIVFVLAIVQLPIALVFGWRYDITDQGIRRTAEVSGSSTSPDSALQRRDHLLIGTLSTAMVAILATGAFSISQLPRVIPAPPENSIAVLPFEICTDQELDITLAPALAMEVINHLAGRPQLKVIARQSSFTMAGFGLSLPKIAEPLGVRYLLKGEVCRDGDIPTLAVELFDEDGAQVWNHRYQQQTDASDRITQTLPSQVADGVAMQLGGVSAIKAVEPVDRKAYEQLLIGREHRRQGNYDEARAALERALEIQPDYAEAVFEMAMLEYSTGRDQMNVGKKMREARPLAEQALELARAQSQQGVSDFRVRWAMGFITQSMARLEQQLAWRDASEIGDEEAEARLQAAQEKYREAEQHLRAAIALNPSETDIRLELALNLDAQGPERRGEALEILMQGLDREPFHVGLGRTLANRLAARGQYHQAMEQLERFKAPGLYSKVRWTQLEIQGNHYASDDKLETLIDALQNDPESFARMGIIGHLWWLTSEMVYLEMYEEAEDLYQSLEQIPKTEQNPWWREFFLVEKYLEATGRGDEVAEKHMSQIRGMSNEEILEAWYLQASIFRWAIWHTGDHERAIALSEGLRHFKHGSFWIERDSAYTLGLIDMYLTAGRDDDAADLLEKLVTYLEREYNAGFRHPSMLHNLALVYAHQKRDDEALDMLGKAVNYSSIDHLVNDKFFNSLQWGITKDPWERFHDDPRYIKEWNRMQALADQRAANIRALLAQHDIDTLLQPVIAMYEKAAAESDE